MAAEDSNRPGAEPRAGAIAAELLASAGTRHALVASPDILGVLTNARHLGWSFGQPPVESTAEGLARCRVVLRHAIEPMSALPEPRCSQRYHYWWGDPGRDELHYERTLIGSSKLRLVVRGLLADNAELRATPAYARVIRFRFNNLHSPGYHLTDIACVQLLRQGLAPLHCSIFARGESAVVVFAPPDTGKTLTTMRAVLERGADFMAEDVAITDGVDAFACPWTSTFRYYDQVAASWRSKVWRRVVARFPPAELMRPGAVETIDRWLPPSRLRARARVTDVVILAARDGETRELDAATAARLVKNLNRYEFAYHKSPLLVAYSYFNPALDLPALAAREEEILGRLVGNARCTLVQSRDPARFADLILDRLP